MNLAKAVNGPGSKEVIDMMRKMKSATLTSLGQALGQDTKDNCPDQQRLRRTLTRLVNVGLIRKVVAEQNLYIWVEEVWLRYLGA